MILRVLHHLLVWSLAIGFLVWGLAIGSSWQGIVIIVAGWLSGRLWPRRSLLRFKIEVLR